MGDVGQTADSAATLQHLVASAPQSILDVGDISYAGVQAHVCLPMEQRLATLSNKPVPYPDL